MRDAILIVGGGLLQVPAVEIARSLGLAVIVTDRNPDAPAMTIADEAAAIDIYDIPAHRNLVMDLSRRWRLRGVFTEGADVEWTVAEAAAAAGLPGVPPASAKMTKNKVLTRRALDRAGIPNPRWAEVTTLADATKAASDIGFPMVVKAVDNSASRGTTKITAASALPEAFAHAVENSSTGTALLEQCLFGEEQSVEILFDEAGRCHRLNVVDRLFAREGEYAIELGHVNPSGLTSEQQGAVFALAERAAQAVGIRFGAFKADTMWTADGPRILEVTGRLSGGFDCQYTTPLATGRDFIRAAMRLAIGEPLDPADLKPTRQRVAAALAAFPPPGRVTRLDGIDDALRSPGVAHVFLRTAIHDEIRPYHDCAARPAFVIAHGATHEEAVSRARQAIARLDFGTRGPGGFTA